jgi:DNA-directed RNA polymerase omega subunit
MSGISPEDFKEKIDSLYRLVIVGSRRANQVCKPESRPLASVESKKPTMVALQEILDDKVSYRIDSDDDEGFEA